jgi:glyoxylase-like metal-dependent hydrolase (beta-lactamase superfamily II)
MKIHTLDLDFQGIATAIASYLVEGPGGPVLVETGPSTTRRRLVEALERHGVAPGDVRDVLVTHIHLDHAGDAGWWASQGARIHVHRNGARHLVDPSRLLQSATRIYGDRMDVLWGEVLPAREDRVVPREDGDVIEAGGLEFHAIDTPGHAGHHHVFRLGRVAFTGDAAGIRLPGWPLVDLPAPPPEFDLESWDRSIDRLLHERFERIYPTHFGPIEAVRDHLRALRNLLHQAPEFLHRRMHGRFEHSDLVEQYVSWNRSRARVAGLDAAAIQRYELANPPSMSVDGILRYWRKREQDGPNP